MYRNRGDPFGGPLKYGTEKLKKGFMIILFVSDYNLGGGKWREINNNNLLLKKWCPTKLKARITFNGNIIQALNNS